MGSIREAPTAISEAIRGRSGAAQMRVEVGIYLELTASVRPDQSYGIQ